MAHSGASLGPRDWPLEQRSHVLTSRTPVLPGGKGPLALKAYASVTSSPLGLKCLLSLVSHTVKITSVQTNVLGKVKKLQ